ncbi:hypothetical protein CGRA01v4_05750 [Colletotrichum graminicola]|nr:hypothetical protein CGRA01v4_05750 [Colletotrichum graminicola]
MSTYLPVSACPACPHTSTDPLPFSSSSYP